MNFFKDIKTVEQLKKEYHKLTMIYHPDKGGTTEQMQQLNAEYTRLFERLKNVHSNAQGEQYTAKEETTETPEQFINIIEQIIHFKNCTIEIIGSWLWVSGNTYPYRNELSSLCFAYAARKKSWCYHNDIYIKNKSNYSIEQLREMYGSQKIVRNAQLALSK